MNAHFFAPLALVTVYLVMTAATPGTGRNSLVDAALGELICPLCICTFKQPRSLSCLHSYCEGCLYGLVKATGSKSQVLSCPECRTDTQLTVGGVEGQWSRVN